MEGQQQRLQRQLQEAQDVVTCEPKERVIAVRHSGRNRGMTPQFEAHVRTLMATGGSARQVRDNLVLNAGHFLEECASMKYKRDIPTERWFSLQREALGVETYTPYFQISSRTQLSNALRTFTSRASHTLS